MNPVFPPSSDLPSISPRMGDHCYPVTTTTDSKAEALGDLHLSTSATKSNAKSMHSQIAPLNPLTIFECESARSYSSSSCYYENSIPSDEFPPSAQIQPPSLKAQRWRLVKEVTRLILVGAVISLLACIIFSAYIAGYYITIPLTIILIALYVDKIASEKEEELTVRSPVVYPVPQSTPRNSPPSPHSTNRQMSENHALKNSSNLRLQERLAQIRKQRHYNSFHSGLRHQRSFPF